MPGGFPLGLEFSHGTDVGTSGSSGTSLTSGTANAYGSYTQLIASTANDACGFVLNGVESINLANQAAVKIAIGGAGSEVVIVNDLLYVAPAARTEFCVFIPVGIPAGTRIAAAMQSPSASDSGCQTSLTLYDGAFTNFEGYAGIDSIGFVSASTGGTSITSGNGSKGSYAQLTASTPRDYAGFFFKMDGANANPSASDLGLLDIAIGGSGSEVIITPNIPVVSSTTTGELNPVSPPIHWVPIPAGTRVAARAQFAAHAITFGLTLYGIYQ